MEEVVSFGGISPPLGGSRTSRRIRLQRNADDTQLQRAKNLAKAKDDAYSAGTSIASKFSLKSIPDDLFVKRANVLGVSLGVSSSEISESIKSIKDIDNCRTLIMIEKKIR